MTEPTFIQNARFALTMDGEHRILKNCSKSCCNAYLMKPSTSIHWSAVSTNNRATGRFYSCACARPVTYSLSGQSGKLSREYLYHYRTCPGRVRKT